MQFSRSVNLRKWISNILSIFKLLLNLINLFLVHLFYLLFFEKFFFNHHFLMEKLFCEQPACNPETRCTVSTVQVMWPTSILNFFEQIPSSTFFLISKLNWIIALSIILCSIYKFQKIGFLKVSEYCAKLWIDRCWNTGSRRRAFLHFVIVN